MLIQKLVRHDSIIASQRLGTEFCNTIRGEAVVPPKILRAVDAAFV